MKHGSNIAATILQGLMLFVKYLMSLHTAKNTELLEPAVAGEVLSSNIFLYQYYEEKPCKTD